MVMRYSLIGMFYKMNLILEVVMMEDWMKIIYKCINILEVLEISIVLIEWKIEILS